MALLKRLSSSSSSLDSCVRDPQAECYERFARRRSWRDADARTNKRRRKREGKEEERGKRSSHTEWIKSIKACKLMYFFLHHVPIFIRIPLRFLKAENTFHEIYVIGKDSDNSSRKMGKPLPLLYYVVFHHREKKLLPPLSFLLFSLEPLMRLWAKKPNLPLSSSFCSLCSLA